MQQSLNCLVFNNSKQAQIQRQNLLRFIQEQGIYSLHKQSSNCWEFSNGKWNEAEMNVVFLEVAVWKNRKIWLNANRQQTMLKEIENIKFPFLSFLSLWGNRIASLEPLSRISMPKLQKLDLSKNCITKAKIMRKSTLPQLTLLNIANNYINDFSHFSESHNDSLNGICLEDHEEQRKKQQGTSLSWVVKLESREVGNLQFENEISTRIRVDLVIQSLQRKYEDIQF